MPTTNRCPRCQFDFLTDARAQPLRGTGVLWQPEYPAVKCPQCGALLEIDSEEGGYGSREDGAFFWWLTGKVVKAQ